MVPVNFAKEQADIHVSALKAIYKDTKKNLILRWIECLEELYILGEYEKPVSSTIAEEMKEELQDIRGSNYALSPSLL